MYARYCIEGGQADRQDIFSVVCGFNQNLIETSTVLER